MSTVKSVERDAFQTTAQRLHDRARTNQGCDAIRRTRGIRHPAAARLEHEATKLRGGHQKIELRIARRIPASKVTSSIPCVRRSPVGTPSTIDCEVRVGVTSRAWQRSGISRSRTRPHAGDALNLALEHGLNVAFDRITH